MKILYLDDDPEEFELLEHTLKLVENEHLEPGTEVIRSTTVAEADAHLENDRPDIVLVDYFLKAGATTDNFIRRVISNSSNPPVVLITGQSNLSLAEEMLSAVADSDLYIRHKRDLDPEGFADLIRDVLRSRFRVLVVDDSETDFQMISMQLGFSKRQRYQCTWADSVAAARRILREEEQEFDAYIIDYHMPAETGTLLVNQLIEKGCTRPIVICSGYSTLDMDAELMRLISTRQVKFLSKNNLSADNLVKRLQPEQAKPR